MRIGSTRYLDDEVVGALVYEIQTSDKFNARKISCYKTVERLQEIAKDIRTRRTLRGEVLEYKQHVTVWRILEGEEEWELFLTDLYAAKVGQRDIDLIKRVINEELISVYEEFKEGYSQNELTLDGVLEVQVKGDRVILKLKDSSLVAKINKIK